MKNFHRLYGYHLYICTQVTITTFSVLISISSLREFLQKTRESRHYSNVSCLINKTQFPQEATVNSCATRVK